MKSFPVVFLLLLIFILSLHSGVATRGSDIAKFCCFKYSRKILPWKSVRSYQFTRNSCPQQAVMCGYLSWDPPYKLVQSSSGKCPSEPGKSSITFCEVAYEVTRNQLCRSLLVNKSLRFTSKKGHKVCAQPKEKWVQRYISLLKKQQ